MKTVGNRTQFNQRINLQRRVFQVNATFHWLIPCRLNAWIFTTHWKMVGTLEHVLTLAIDRKLHPDTSTLRDFAKIRSDMIIRSLKGIVVEVNKEVYLSDSHRAHELTFKWALNDRLVKYVQYYFVVNGAVGFTFSCIYTLASFREIKDEVKSIVEALLPRRAP